jgi:predicted aminopeptidase
MLGYSDDFLIQTIIHELVHQTVWVKGSVSFNESLANFVGDKGAQAYLAWRDGKDSAVYQHYQDVHADAAVLRQYMHDIVTRLEVLYASPVSRDEKIRQREQIFAAAKAEYSLVFPRMKTTRYRRYFERRRLNNAVMLSFRRYNRDTTYFDNIFQAHDGDLRRMVAYFATLRPDQIPAKFRTR